MLGLFIKDLKLLKAQKKMFMLVGIVTAVVLFNIQDGILNLCQRPETTIVYDSVVLVRKLLIKLLRFRRK